MRLLVITACIVGVVVLAFFGLRVVQYFRLFPPSSTEIVRLTPEKRAHLQRLRAETKFQPNDYPPLGYTGAETPQDRARATAVVNAVIDRALAQSDGSVRAGAISSLIGKAMRDVDMLATEDRDRTQGYLLEIWYILGFKGSTGRFAYGSAYSNPDGYGEPLPPGWSAPDKPRRID
jgi:hypothetical protein